MAQVAGMNFVWYFEKKSFLTVTVEGWECISNFIPHFTAQWNELLIHAEIKVNPC